MSDKAIKNLVATTCVVVIAAVGWFALSAYQQSQTSELDKLLAEQARLVKAMQRSAR